jgi:hypothetical protein
MNSIQMNCDFQNKKEEYEEKITNAIETVKSCSINPRERWVNVCKNKIWSTDDITLFCDTKSLFKENVTYAIGKGVLLAQANTREEANGYEAWNLEMVADKYYIHILHMYEE